jgi:gliding motility-associated-like protein
MNFNCINRLFFFVILFFFIGFASRTIAQPTTCFAIEGLLVDACGTHEGENEMIYFQVGPNNLNSANLVTAWPLNNNPWRGICQDATTARKVAAFNRTILRCGLLIEPVSGVLPAGKKVLFFTSEAVDTTLSSFANLQDTIIAIFQCVGNTQGHFVNYGTAGIRTLKMTFTGTGGCTDSVSYHPDSLRNQAGNHAAQDGEGVHFTSTGVASYYWNPCMPPVIAPYVIAGPDITTCRGTQPIPLNGSADISTSVYWHGGMGTFGRRDTTVTTYTPSPLDPSPLYLYLTRKICAVDSIVDSVRITFTTPSASTVNASICAGHTYQVGAHTYNTSGTYRDTLITGSACDSIITTNLSFTIPFSLTLPFSGCGQVSYGGFTFTSSTILHDTLRSAGGCDSLYLVVNITIKQPSSNSQTVNICTGHTLTIGSHVYTLSGIYHDTLTNAMGCDSFLTTNLTFTTPLRQTLPFSGCGQVSYGGFTFTTSTALRDTFRTAGGCDSLYLVVNISIKQASNNSQIVSLCPGHSLTIGSHIYTMAGIYHDTLTNAMGCDSFLTTNLTFNNPQSVSLPVMGCGQVSFRGITYSSNTIIHDTLMGQGGCDSLYLTANITINQPSSFSQSVWICQGQSITEGSHIYTIQGTYLDTLTNVVGCDSFLTTHLTVDTVMHQTTNLTGCNQVIYNGNTYNTSAILNQTILNQRGCDSIVKIVNIVVTGSILFIQDTVLCRGHTLIVGIKSYGSSGFYIDTLRNATAGGCDSIIHTVLTVIVPYTASVQLSDTCTASYKGHLYTSGAVIQETVISQRTGCDSIYLTVTLTIVTPTFITHNKNVSICLGQSYLAGGHLQTSAGIYSDTLLTSTGGCDSLINITTLSVISPQFISQKYDTCNPIKIGNVTYSSDTVISDTILSALGCISRISSDTVHIRKTNISIMSTVMLPINEGDSTQLVINPTGTYQNVIWSPNQWIINRYLQDPIVLPDVTTAYMVSAEDSNHCQVSAEIIITVTPLDQPFAMPSAFSPNGDNKNDLYGPILSPNAQLATFHIYNRWGELVFDKNTNGTNEWDGKYKGAVQPTGIYMYFVTVVSSLGKTINKEGSFTLLH